jgi:adenylosuccinate synthase
MLLEQESIGAIVKSVYDQDPPDPSSLYLENPLYRDDVGVRPNSASIEDTAFGDSGKGRIAQQINSDLIKNSSTGLLFSERYNGAANAGHEVFVGDVVVALHQLPVAAIQEGAIAILGKGMLVHPDDLAREIAYVENSIGAALPARLLIDKYATVTTDLHRAYESFMNALLGAGAGNTSSGVSPGYASYYEKRAIQMKDLVADNWRETFGKQYDFYAELMGADRLASGVVKALTLSGKKQEHAVGSREEFLDRLEDARKVVRDYVTDVHSEVADVWKNYPHIPFTLESAQGPLLDPWHGLYPDITASRPNGITGIADSTEGVIQYDQIALKVAVLKTPYMSSVGARRHPYFMNEDIAEMYRVANGEMGKSTGRKRGIYPLDLVAMRYAKDVSRYDYVAITHFDSNYAHIPIEVVVDYVSKNSGESQPYRPYQEEWDKIRGQIEHLPSWDGTSIVGMTRPEELPPESLKLISLMERVLAPVVMVTNGPRLGETIYLAQ